MGARIWGPVPYRGARVSRSGGGSGGSGEFPLFVNFDGATPGDDYPDGWSAQDPGVDNNPLIQTALTKGTWTPGTNEMLFGVDATHAVKAEYSLPSFVTDHDFSTGYRIVVWDRCVEINGQADQTFGLSDVSQGDWSAITAVAFRPRAPSPSRMEFYSYVSGVYQDMALANGAMTLSSWHCTRVEYDPGDANPVLLENHRITGDTTSVTEISARSNPAWAGTFPWSTFAPVYFGAATPLDGTYSGETALLGFWLGRLTDDWPAIHMPLTL